MRSSIDVHNHLLDEDVPHEISQLPGPLRDLTTAPGVLGLPAEAVGRPTVLTDRKGCVVVLAPAHQEVDVRSVAELLDRKQLAPLAADRAPGLTGYLLGVTPPVGLACSAVVVLDECIAAQDVVYTGAGETGLILKVRGRDLVKATSAVVARVTRASR